MAAQPFRPEGVPQELPRGPHSLKPEVVLASQRGRLLTAFLELTVDRLPQDVTITEITRRAGTSKSAFYQHFASKEECVVAAFDVAWEHAAAAIVEAADEVSDPIERIAVGVSAYLDVFLRNPELARLLLRQIRSDHPGITEHWHGWLEAMATQLVAWRDRSREAHPEVPPLSRLQAIGAIAAINDMVAATIHRGGTEALPAARAEIVAIATAFLTADAEQG